jgi:hypothetical protein
MKILHVMSDENKSDIFTKNVSKDTNDISKLLGKSVGKLINEYWGKEGYCYESSILIVRNNSYFSLV